MSEVSEAIQAKCLAFGDRIIKLNDYLLAQAVAGHEEYKKSKLQKNGGQTSSIFHQPPSISVAAVPVYLQSISNLCNQLFNNSFIDTQLPDIIDEAFTKWVRSIKMPTAKAYDCIGQEALYLTFNYTDTLEGLYQVLEQQVLHIHGRASRGEKLIVGHNREINPGDYWDDGIDMRENNERMQRLTDMNTLCKPVYEIIERNDWFFKRLNSVKDIHIIGHSCEAVDYPYFRKVKESVNTDALWHFNPHSDDDKVREKNLIEEIGIESYVFNE